MDRRQLVTGLATVPLALALPAGLPVAGRAAAEDWHSAETDADRIWAEIVTRIWPETGSADPVTYGQLIDIINRLGFPVPFPDAPAEPFTVVARAVRMATGIRPERRQLYLQRLAASR